MLVFILCRIQNKDRFIIRLILSLVRLSHIMWFWRFHIIFFVSFIKSVMHLAIKMSRSGGNHKICLLLTKNNFHHVDNNNNKIKNVTQL